MAAEIHKADLFLARRAFSDEDAFREILEKYERLIYNVAYRSSGNEADAADITQETFLKAWRSLPAFRGECALSTWLCKIALSVSCDSARKGRRQRTLPLTQGDEEDPFELPLTDVSAMPEEEAVRKMEIDAVRAAVDALPEEQRILVTMRDLSDMTYADIAEALGLEMGTVKSRLFRARAALKEFLLAGNFFGEPSSKETNGRKTERTEVTEETEGRSE